MNKHAAGDIRTIFFAVFAFIIILSGGLTITTHYLNSKSITQSSEIQQIQEITGENSDTSQYLKDVQESNRDDETDQNILEKIRDRFEDNMLYKAFKTAKLVGNTDKIVDDAANNDGINSILHLNEVSWVSWSIGIFIGALFIFALVYFFRGLS